MYTLKAKVNFYDKEHPGRLIHSGELLTTKDEARVQNLLALHFAEVVTVDEPEAPKAEPVKESVEAQAAEAPEAPAEEAKAEADAKTKEEAAEEAEAEPEKAEAESEAEAPEVAEVVTVGSESYPVAVVKEALNAIDVKTAANAGVKAVSKKVSELSKEKVQELAKVLTK